MPAPRVSGSLFVIIVLGLALLGVGLTWVFYHRDNPTSTDGTLTLQNGTWTASARFAPDELPRLRPGTGVLLTSPEFPDLRMTGTIADANPDASITIALIHGPPTDTAIRNATCRVTVDSATAPQ